MATAKKSIAASFVNSFVAFIEGDDAKVIAEKAYRQSQSALKSHISSYEGDTIDLEEKVSEAKEELAKAEVNFGKKITDRKAYVSQLFSYQNKVTEAEEALEDHVAKIDFLKERLA